MIVASRAVRTGAAVERALRDGLGAEWRSAIDPAIAARLRRRLPRARILFVPWPFRPREVQRLRDIRYGAAGERNLLDIYRHRARPSGGQVLVYFHGGGFFSGRKNREARPLLHRLASQGWVCVSANYRLRPAATFADHLIDAKRAIAWARTHAHEYGAEPDLMFVSGSSAGGHLAATAALTPNEPAFHPGFEDADTSVAAAITLYGYLGPYYGHGGESSPEHYVRADAPFFIAQGDHDTHSPRFQEIARRFAVFQSIRFSAVIAAIEAFAAWVRSTQASEREPTHRDATANPRAGMCISYRRVVDELRTRTHWAHARRVDVVEPSVDQCRELLRRCLAAVSVRSGSPERTTAPASGRPAAATRGRRSGTRARFASGSLTDDFSPIRRSMLP